MIGNKDIDRKILNNLDDEDLVNVCQVNKKAHSICNDQVFWMNRVFLKFGYVGGNVLRTNKKNQSWSEYYIKDLRKINSNNSNQYLISGSDKGKLDHVIISLNLGANIHAENDYALRIASQNGHIDIVKYLVELKPDGANIYAQNEYALRFAIKNDHIEVVKYLVGVGTDINKYALQLANYYTHLSIVQYLESLS